MLINTDEENRKRIIIALDFAQEQEVLRFLDRLDPGNCRVKIGKELFTACGPALVKKVQQRGFDIFLDLKFHDIPNTVAGAVRAAALELGVWMMNVHASGGRAMLEAAAGALSDIVCWHPHVIGVTVLTSLSDDDLAELGVRDPARDQVLRLPACAMPRVSAEWSARRRKSPCCARICHGDFCSLRRESAAPAMRAATRSESWGRARPSPRAPIIWWSADRLPAPRTPRRRLRNLCPKFQAICRIRTSLFWQPQGCFFFQLRIRTPS